jgi:hypothetical protein
MNKNHWHTLEGNSISSIYDFIEKEIEEKINQNCKTILYIGTDSQNIRDKWTSFVQVVCLHFIDKGTGIGIGGRVAYIRHVEALHTSNLRRLIREAEISINLAKSLEPIISKFDLDFEVHADVNSDPKYESHAAYSTVYGWITSLGYNCVPKPGSWVASIVADRHTRKFSRKERKLIYSRLTKQNGKKHERKRIGF